MVSRRWFFSPAAGVRLREIRTRALLTQEEVATRMETNRLEVWRLERGRVRAPLITAVGRYLQACGASWFDLAGVLDEVEPLTVRSKVIGRSRLKSADRYKVLDDSDRQTLRYQQSLRFTHGRRPLPPAQQAQMARRLRNYRVVANLVEQNVTAMLRLEPVVSSRYPHYRAVARHLLGLLWRMARTTKGKQELSSRRRDLAESIRAELQVKDAFWRKQRLDADLVARTQEIVTAQFRSLLRNSPQLFGRGGRTRQ